MTILISSSVIEPANSNKIIMIKHDTQDIIANYGIVVKTIREYINGELQFHKPMYFLHMNEDLVSAAYNNKLITKEEFNLHRLRTYTCADTFLAIDHGVNKHSRNYIYKFIEQHLGEIEEIADKEVADNNSVNNSSAATTTNFPVLI